MHGRAVRLMVAAGLVMSSAAAAPAGSAAGDPLRPRQWALDRIHADDAWRVSTGRGVLVAVIDSGVDAKHPDLARQVVVRRGADVVDPDGCLDNGCRDDGTKDLTGHGTAMAGIIAAAAGNGGVVGVAPRARILPVRVNSPNSFTVRGVARGIRYAADNGARVISMSLAFPETPYPLSSAGAGGGLVDANQEGLDELFAAVEHAWAKGAVLVAAAGNGFPSTLIVDPAGPSFAVGKPECGAPAIHPLVLCVGAVDRADRHAYYSDYRLLQPEMLVVGPSGGEVGDGPTGTAVAPCADRILAPYPKTVRRACAGDAPEGFTYISGTSSATAVVSGIAALLIAQGRSNAEVIDVLRSTAIDLGPPGTDPVYGEGLVDAAAAVRAPRSR